MMYSNKKISPKDMNDVRQRLATYDFIFGAYLNLTDDEQKIFKEKINFYGFDGNSDGALLAYAETIIGGYKHLQNYLKSSGDELNSHDDDYFDTYKLIQRYESTKDIQDQKERLKKILDI